MMEKLLALLAFPLVWPFIARRIWHTQINLTEMVINIVLVVFVSFGVWELGKYGQLTDTEIWNGFVTAKNREHGHYITSYSCNCRETCSGSGESRSCAQTCDTCYEDHYTVTWTADTTVGNVTFDKKDSTWRSVYNSLDPGVYTRCKVGEPVKAEYTEMENILAQGGLKVKEVAQVPGMMSDDLARVSRDAMTGRYGDKGSQAVFQWIQENYPGQVSPTLYTQLQQAIEAFRDKFQNEQTKFIDTKRSYETNLGYFWKGFWLRIAGYPKIDLEKFKIISSGTAQEAFESGVDVPIKLR